MPSHWYKYFPSGLVFSLVLLLAYLIYLLYVDVILLFQQRKSISSSTLMRTYFWSKVNRQFNIYNIYQYILYIIYIIQEKAQRRINTISSTQQFLIQDQTVTVCDRVTKRCVPKSLSKEYKFKLSQQKMSNITTYHRHNLILRENNSFQQGQLKRCGETISLLFIGAFD
ncbi:Hypothetical_protein [Hexamita inflata]|uniref:Hypothetical_protein n=1 Tax=Hexamita inflata TaxID=28002 RepID=A0AA86P2M2_9EUKA|nr:Hypothetical protein HINF_LOCUS16929 [Hexamita inflata]